MVSVPGVPGYRRTGHLIHTSGCALTLCLPLQFVQFETPAGSGQQVVCTDRAGIDREFRRAWMPFFCRSDWGAACEDAFTSEVGRWLPRLPVIDLPPLDGQMLCDAVAGEYASAGSLDGWKWRVFKALSVSWFDGLASILRLIEDSGEWPQGLLDANMVMIPKAEGMPPLGQRSTYCVWVVGQVRAHLQTWCDSWLPSSVFSVV